MTADYAIEIAVVGFIVSASLFVLSVAIEIFTDLFKEKRR